LLLGIITIIVGAIGALKQKDLKRMLAFSSISQMGYIIAGLATFIPLGIIGAIFHLFNHATFKTVLFLNSASIEKNANTTEMKNLGGLEHNMPWTSWTSIIALFSTAGVPPLSGFWSKIMIIIALWLSGFKISAVIALIFSIITLAYFMIMQKKIFFGQKKEYFNFGEVSIPMLSPVILMSLIIIFAGIFFPYVFDYLKII
jgi:multicomponent Na+:H+ antiporter subunit D